jgi:hypothetical protein
MLTPSFLCSTEKNRDKLARDGAIPLLIKSIASSNDFTLKLACAATLWNLSVNGTVFLLHFGFPRFQVVCNEVLTDFAFVDKNKKTIVEEGAVPIFVNLLKSTDVKLPNEAVKLQNEAVGALRNLSLDGSPIFRATRPFTVSRSLTRP